MMLNIEQLTLIMFCLIYGITVCICFYFLLNILLYSRLVSRFEHLCLALSKLRLSHRS